MDSDTQRPPRPLTADFLDMDFGSAERRVIANVLFPVESPYQAIPARETSPYLQDFVRDRNYEEAVSAVFNGSFLTSATVTSTVPQGGNLTAAALTEMLRERERLLPEYEAVRRNYRYPNLAPNLALDYGGISALDCRRTPLSRNNPYSAIDLTTNPCNEVALPGGGWGRDQKPNPFDLVFKEEALPPKDPVQLELF